MLLITILVAIFLLDYVKYIEVNAKKRERKKKEKLLHLQRKHKILL